MDQIQKVVSFFVGNAEASEYNQALNAEAVWWKGLKDVVGEILTSVGADEFTVDDIQAISKKIDVSLLRTVL